MVMTVSQVSSQPAVGCEHPVRGGGGVVPYLASSPSIHPSNPIQSNPIRPANRGPTNRGLTLHLPHSAADCGRRVGLLFRRRSQRPPRTTEGVSSASQYVGPEVMGLRAASLHTTDIPRIGLRFVSGPTRRTGGGGKGTRLHIRRGPGWMGVIQSTTASQPASLRSFRAERKKKERRDENRRPPFPFPFPPKFPGEPTRPAGASFSREGWGGGGGRGPSPCSARNDDGQIRRASQLQ